ncbi:AAA family ATPase [Horticoccus sp. 23ND18S-11]|uniref:AAA family ATPase n=1 Tax=Horticoccus sp. 23ND18S-11 TaxID=3391832 RepID=UPI0039C8D326
MSAVKRFRRGLVVGKFAPLHRGHEYVIRRAVAECDEVVVISYSKPEIPGCEPEKRAQWLAELFPATRRLVLADTAIALPDNAADDTTHRRFVGRVCVDELGVTVDAVFTSEAYGDGFARELTAYFRTNGLPHAPAVTHVRVDPDRATVPISGTAIRSDVHAHRGWLDPAVYASFVERVCFLGGESSGKSTLAAALAAELGTTHVPEFARELWDARRGVLVFDDLRTIAIEQVQREDAAARRAVRKVFCDTSALTTRLYSLEMFGRVDPEVERLAARRYDHVFLCAPDFAFVQDGTRRDAAFRQRQHAWYEAELARRGMRYQTLGGSLVDRMEQVKAALGVTG